jgi:hypothetical protein
MKVQHASSGFEREKDDKSRDHGREDSNRDREEDDGGDRHDW